MERLLRHCHASDPARCAHGAPQTGFTEGSKRGGTGKRRIKRGGNELDKWRRGMVKQHRAGFKCVEALGRIIIRGAPTHPQML